MVETIYALARFQVRKENLQRFKGVLASSILNTEIKDKETNEYNWYYDEQAGEFLLREAYTNSQALIQHVQNMGPLMADLKEFGSMRVEIFGNPTPELQELAQNFKVKVYPFYQGAKL